MKKLLAIVFAMMMVMSLVGCADTGEIDMEVYEPANISAGYFEVTDVHNDGNIIVTNDEVQLIVKPGPNTNYKVGDSLIGRYTGFTEEEIADTFTVAEDLANNEHCNYDVVGVIIFDDTK